MKILILAFALLTPLAAFSAEFSGTVVGITDGDTLEVLTTEKKTVKIRLVEIDAPEKKQSFGIKSKQSLSDICFKKPVIVVDKGLDKYQRTLGRLSCNGVDANAEQVKRGMAWAFRKYLTDTSISDYEQQAKTNKIGLWADVNSIPPWDFRHSGKAEVKNTKAISEKKTTNNKFECAGKRKCKEMTNCEEAEFYLKECGVAELDRNRDGVPCESICK
jgi:endonuclease YncB( thermonuclease family)